MSQGARWAALVCVSVAVPAAAGLAQTTSSNTALPPLSGPPIDVPMRVPQPPHNVDASPPQAQSAPIPPAPAKSALVRPAPQVVAAPRRGDTITPIVPQCRETAYRVIIDGRPETAVARICRMADGRWRLAP